MRNNAVTAEGARPKGARDDRLKKKNGFRRVFVRSGERVVLNDMWCNTSAVWEELRKEPKEPTSRPFKQLETYGRPTKDYELWEEPLGHSPERHLLKFI